MSRSRTRRAVARRNADGQSGLQRIDFFSSLSADEAIRGTPEEKAATTAALADVQKSVEARKVKLKTEAAQQAGVRQALRTDRQRAEREQRARAQLQAGRPVASFNIEYDPVRVLDDGITVKGNVIEGVAYVFQLPRIQRDTYPFVSLGQVYVESQRDSQGRQSDTVLPPTYGGGNGFRATMGSLMPAPGQDRVDAMQEVIEGFVVPSEQKMALYQRRLAEARAAEDKKAGRKKTEEQIVQKVMERMLQDHLNETQGLAGKQPLKLSTIMQYAKRRLSKKVGYDELLLTTPTNRRVNAYIFVEADNIDWAPAANTKAYRNSAKQADPLKSIDALLTKEVRKLRFFEGDISNRELVAFVAVPTSQAERYESTKERRRAYKAPKYTVSGGRLKSEGPLYIAITQKSGGRINMNKGVVVGVRYRMAADNRASLLSLYEKGDPRSRNPYYSFVFGGFRESFDPTRYLGAGNEPLTQPFLEASRDTMKQYAAIRDVVSTTQYFTKTIARLHSFFSQWDSEYLLRRRQGLEFNDSCLMPLQVPANTEDPQLLNLRLYQGRAERAVYSAMQSYVSLFFLLRNILRRANVKATRRSSARDFAVFDPAQTMFGNHEKELAEMQQGVASLLGRDVKGHQISLELTQLNELALFEPLQEMLGAAGDLAGTDDIIAELMEKYNAATDETERKKLWAQVTTAKKGRGAKRQGRKAAREAREAREKLLMQQAAEARGMAEMSPYQYRRYLAEQGATEMIAVWQSVITAPVNEVLALARTYLGFSPLQSGGAWLDQGACFLFLSYMCQFRGVDGQRLPRFTFASSALLTAITIHAKSQRFQQAAVGDIANKLMQQYAEHIRERNEGRTRGKKRQYPILKKGEALRTQIVREATSIGFGQYPQFRALLEYFAATEKCIDEAAEQSTAAIFKMGEYPRNVKMLSIMALGIAMKWFTPTVTNTLDKLPDEETFLDRSILKKFEQTAEDIQTDMRLPNYRQLGQQMRAQYGMETFYTYNPLLFAYLQQKGSETQRLPRELQKQSEAFGVYGNFIVQLRTTANGLLNAGINVDGISLAQTFNDYADSYRFPGVPKLENEDGITPAEMNPQGAEELLYTVNDTLKAAAMQTIALGARIGGDTMGVAIPTGVGTYGAGLGPAGPRAEERMTGVIGLLEKNKDAEAKAAFLRAVSIYVRALAPDLNLDTTFRTKNERAAEKASIKKLAPIDAELRKLKRLETKNVTDLLEESRLNAKRADVLYSSGLLLPQAEIAALVKIYTGYGREGYAQEKTATGGKYGQETYKQEVERMSKPPNLTKLPKPVRTALEVALSPTAEITNEDVEDMEMVLSSLAYQYMIIAKSRPIPRVSVGAAQDRTVVSPALQASAAKYASYAQGLAEMNRQVSNYIRGVTEESVAQEEAQRRGKTAEREQVLAEARPLLEAYYDQASQIAEALERRDDLTRQIKLLERKTDMPQAEKLQRMDRLKAQKKQAVEEILAARKAFRRTELKPKLIALLGEETFMRFTRAYRVDDE
jgi:hypothetical protein